MTYPHRLVYVSLPPVEAWPTNTIVVCRCGSFGDDRRDCPAALQERIAELERGQGSMHKAADAGRREGQREERERIAAWLEASGEVGPYPDLYMNHECIAFGEGSGACCATQLADQLRRVEAPALPVRTRA